MNEQSSGFDIQPTGEQFQIPNTLEMIRNRTSGGTPEAIKKYFETLSFEDFSELLNGLNAYFRRISGQHKMDGDKSLTDGYMPPSPEDRIPLLKEAFEKAIREDTPEKCATVLGMSILTIHPYLDGNGRTSRTIFALLTNGYSGNDEDKALFTTIGQKDNEDPEYDYHPSGSYIIDLDPSNIKVGDHVLSDLIYGEMTESAFIKKLGSNFSNHPIRVGFSNRDWNYDPESKLTREEQLELCNIFGSNSLAFIACIRSFSDELYEKSLRHINFESHEYDVIAYRNIIKDITNGDLSNLRSAFRQTRIDYVRKIMDLTDRDDFQDIFRQYSDKLEGWKIKIKTC